MRPFRKVKLLSSEHPGGAPCQEQPLCGRNLHSNKHRQINSWYMPDFKCILRCGQAREWSNTEQQQNQLISTKKTEARVTVAQRSFLLQSAFGQRPAYRAQ